MRRGAGQGASPAAVAVWGRQIVCRALVDPRPDCVAVASGELLLSFAAGITPRLLSAAAAAVAVAAAPWTRRPLTITSSPRALGAAQDAERVEDHRDVDQLLEERALHRWEQAE